MTLINLSRNYITLWAYSLSPALSAPEDEYDVHVDRILSMLQAGTLSASNLQNMFPGAPKQVDYRAFFEDVSHA